MTPSILITGASSGIGAEFARLAAREGYDVIITARRTDMLEALAAEIRRDSARQVLVIGADLSAASGASALWQAVQASGWRPGILINNAGIGCCARFEDTPLETDLRQVEVNVLALVALCKHFVHALRAGDERGKILNVASIGAMMAGPGMATYCATKAFILSFSEALNHEFAGSGISVTALCPGPTESGFLDVAGIKRNGLVPYFLAPAANVARHGWRSMHDGRAVTVDRIALRIMLFFARFFPRSLVTKMTGVLIASVA